MSYSYASRSPAAGPATSRKQHSEKNQQILKTLLKEAPNKFCADCKTSKNPRWASWNLGIFVCIRCSGIHRSMGTHISRVKSVDLDSWTDEQVKSMVLWGNSKANTYWEGKLPDNYTPDEGKIENFIRTKYELRKWCSSSTVPDPTSIKAASQSSAQPQQAPPLASAPPQAEINLKKASPQPKLPPQPTASLLDLTTSSSAPSTVSPTVPSTVPSLISDLTSNKPVAGSTVPQQSARPDLKKSILSLYSTPARPTNPAVSSMPNLLSGSSSGSGSGSVPNTFNNSFSNLNLGASAPANNVWTSATNSTSSVASSNVWANSSGLSGTKKGNEDLFSNVWS